MKPFVQTEYGSKQDPNLVRFVELLCSPDSELRESANFEERLAGCCKATGLEQTIFSQEKTKEVIYHYMSFYLYSNKHQVLLSSQIQFWNINKLALRNIEFAEADDGSKELTLHDKITDLLTKLESKISKLISEIYGAEEIGGIAKEQIKKVGRSLEQRLKEK